MEYETALADINKNKEAIYNNIAVDSKVFSFPYGQYDPVLVSNLKGAGYNVFVSTDFRTNMVMDKEIALGRFNRDSYLSTKEFFDFVDTKCL